VVYFFVFMVVKVVINICCGFISCPDIYVTRDHMATVNLGMSGFQVLQSLGIASLFFSVITFALLKFCFMSKLCDPCGSWGHK